MPLDVPQRHFAVLVAGPVTRVDSRKDEFVRIIAEEIARYMPSKSS